MLTMGTTQHTQTVVGVCWLADLDFAVGMQRLTTAPRNLVVGGYTYTALGNLASVDAVAESAASQADQLTLRLAATNTAMLALARGGVAGYRGRRVKLYLQLFDDRFVPVGTAVPRWAGVMNKVGVSRKPAELGSAGAGTGSIDLVCSRSGMARARHYKGLRLTDAQQQARWPGDTGLRYVRGLIEQPVQWLSKKFQEQ